MARSEFADPNDHRTWPTIPSYPFARTFDGRVLFKPDPEDKTDYSKLPIPYYPRWK